MAALTFWVLWTGFHLIQKVFDYYTPLPMWDYWRVVEQLNDYRSFHLAAFWRQHNEHRIVFPEIAFALDMVLLHGRMLLPIALSSLSYLGTWLVLSGTVIGETSVAPFTRAVAILVSALVAFWQSAAGVLAVPFLLQWTLVQLAAAVALATASRLRSSMGGSTSPLLSRRVLSRAIRLVTDCWCGHWSSRSQWLSVQEGIPWSL